MLLPGFALATHSTTTLGCCSLLKSPLKNKTTNTYFTPLILTFHSSPVSIDDKIQNQ